MKHSVYAKSLVAKRENKPSCEREPGRSILKTVSSTLKVVSTRRRNLPTSARNSALHRVQRLSRLRLRIAYSASMAASGREHSFEPPESGRSLFGLHEALIAEGRRDEAAKVQARFERAWRAADVKLDAAAL